MVRRVLVTALVVATLLAGCGRKTIGFPGPPATDVPVTGDVTVHDPGLVVGDDTHPWFVFSTGDERIDGGAIQVRTSPDGHDWTYAGPAWTASTEPSWVVDAVPGVTNFWAPEVIRHDGTWYLYYAASTFGSNRSAIGLRTARLLDPSDPSRGWTDRGEVLGSEPGDDVNAIDPAPFTDAEGHGWMAYGSFWSGIRIVPISWPSGKPSTAAQGTVIASWQTSTNAVEAASLSYHDGWYYLFVSFGFCCQGIRSTYSIHVGRSRAPQGPYLDADGVDLAQGGGTELLRTIDDRVGPGGESVRGDWIAYHYYDAARGGAPHLALRRLGWTGTGWPVVRDASELPPDATTGPG